MRRFFSLVFKKNHAESGMTPLPLHSRKNSLINNQRGNIFFTLFGAVAVVGLLGTVVVSTMRGPLSTMVEVQDRTKAESEMAIASRLVLLEATQLALDGDCDSDGFVEPLEYMDAGGSGPTGGGFLPNAVASTRVDPWGTEYGYCSWDAGAVTGALACDTDGSAVNERLDGNAAPADETYTVIALVSAGPDQAFNTTCTGGASPSITKGGDDMVVEFTYGEATAATNGLWNIKSGDPATAEISKNLEVTGGAAFTSGIDLTGSSAALQLGAASMLFPTEGTLTTCNGANDGLLRLNTTTDPDTLELCDDPTGWIAVGAGVSLWSNGTGDDIFYNSGTPQVGIGTATPDDTLDVVGTAQITGSTVLGSTLDAQGAIANSTGNLSLNDAVDITGALDAQGTIANSTGNVNIGDDLTVTGTSDLQGTISNSTGDVNIGDNVSITGTSNLQGTVSNSTGDVNIGDNIVVTGTADMQGTISNSTGDVTLGDAVDITGALDAQGTISNSTGNVDISDTVDVTGSVNISQNLDVDGVTESDDYTWNGNDFTPATCASGSFNRWSGTSWVCENDTSGSGSGGTNAGIFEDIGATPTVIRMKSTIGTDYSDVDFVFGSPTLSAPADPNYYARFFFDKDLAAFRAGDSAAGAWDTANLGQYSFAGGNDTLASGDYSTAFGNAAKAIGDYSFASGTSAIASGNVSTAFGGSNVAAYNTHATGSISTAIGLAATASGDLSIALGTGAIAGDGAFTANDPQQGSNDGTVGEGAMAIGLSTTANLLAYTDETEYPRVTGDQSLGIFMGDQTNYNLSTANRMALVGGDFLIDDDGTAGSQGCIRYLEGSGLQFSDDCTNFTTLSGLGGTGNGLWEISAGVTRVKASATTGGDYATDDFVFGSPQLSDSTNINHDARMFFDKSKGAFRAGRVTGAEWDDANVGSDSIALGTNTSADSSGSVAIGGGANATSNFAVAISTASAFATGQESIALGGNIVAAGFRSRGIGHDVNITGTGSYSMGIGLGDATGARPQVSAANSLGIFMGDQTGYDLATANRMALVGGDFLIDDDGTAGSQGCIRYLEGTGLQFSNDCSTFSSFASLGSLWTDNTTHITRENVHILDAGQTIDTASLNGGVGTALIWDTDNGSLRGGSASGTQWNDTNIGTNSLAYGTDARADGSAAVALGGFTQASGNYSISLGREATVSGANSMAIGLGAPAGADPIVSGEGSLGIFSGDQTGEDLNVDNIVVIEGANLMVGPGSLDSSTFIDAIFTVASTSSGTAIRWGPNHVNSGTLAGRLGYDGGSNRVDVRANDGDLYLEAYDIGGGNYSQIFMDSSTSSVGIGSNFHTGVDTIESTFHIQSGDIRLDGGEANEAGCLRFDDTTDKLQFSNDCTTFTDIDSVGGSLWTDNTTHITRENVHILDAGQTIDTASLNGGVGTALIWDTDNGAFRAGFGGGTTWDDANIGTHSFAFGHTVRAAGTYATVFGSSSYADGNSSFVAGAGSGATGIGSFTLGNGNQVLADNSFSLGGGGDVTGTSSAAITLGSYAGTDPVVSGDESLGIFMGDQTGYDLSTANRMALVGGDFLIDDDGTAGSQGCIRYLEGTGLQFSHDCSTYSTMGTASGVVLSGVTAATADNSISNAAWNQTWNWQLTAAETGMAFGESAASTGGADNQYILSASTLATSTAIPLYVNNLGTADSFEVNANGTLFTIETDGDVVAGKDVAVTGNISAVNATFTGDLTIPDDGLFMATTNTAGHMLINNGTNFNPVAMSGDATIASTGAITIANDAIEESMLNATGAPTDEYCLTYEADTTNFEWVDCATAAAGTSLWTDNTTHITRENFHILDAGLVAGSTTAGIDSDGTKAFYDPDKAAMRGGSKSGGHNGWLDTNIGTNSFAWGDQTTASGSESIALGYLTSATGNGSVALGSTVTASGTSAIAIGASTTASGDYSFASGIYTSATNDVSTAMGREVGATGFSSFGVGLHTATQTTDPVVSGARSFGIFMDGGVADATSTMDLAANDTFAIIGGDFIVGSYQMDDTTTGNEDNRMFFDRSKGAFRVGRAMDTRWDDASVGLYSIAMGSNSSASGDYGTASGSGNYASGNYTVAMGQNNNASQSWAVALGEANQATGWGSIAIGGSNTSSGGQSVALGRATTAAGDQSFTAGDQVTVTATGDNSAAFGLGSAAGIHPQVSGASSFGIFMGDQSGYDLTTANRMALVGGDFLIDDDGTAGSQGCIRYLEGTGLQFSHDCSTYSTMGSASAIAINDLTDAAYETSQFNMFLGHTGGSFGSNNVGNIGIGFQTLDALDNTTNGDLNTAVGAFAMTATTTGYNNSAFGNQALTTNTTGYDNTAIGMLALGANTTGYANTAVGRGALDANIGGNDNVAVGTFALTDNTSGTSNVAIGSAALGNNDDGSRNVTISGMFDNVSGGRNVAIGYGSLSEFIATGDSYNVAIGYAALQGVDATSTGVNNTTLGAFAGDSITTGDGNIVIGYGADVADPTADSQLVIGNTIYGDLATYVIGIGDFSADTIDSTLHLASGDIRLDGGAANEAGCLRYDDTADELQYSDDCTTFTAFGDLAATLLWTDNTTHITREALHVLDTGQTSDSVAFSVNGGAGADQSIIFFDTDKRALRGGFLDIDDTNSDAWDDANIGNNSIAWGDTVQAGLHSAAFGRSTTASGTASFAAGDFSNATGYTSIALGYNALSSANSTIALGSDARATADSAIALGASNRAQAANSVVIGQDAWTGAAAANSFAFGLGNATGTDPIVSAANSFGIFMGDQSGQDLTSANTMSVMGGDLIVGSTQLDDTTTGNEDSRMFFDRSKGAFRAGWVSGSQWDDASVGDYSVALGANTTASGDTAVALGGSSSATQDGAVAIGTSVYANAQSSTVIGENLINSGYRSLGLGYDVNVTGSYSAGIGLGNASSTRPVVSADNSFGIFMGDQDSVDLAVANRMGLYGGDLLIDDDGTAGSQGCIRYLEGTGLQFSHDCSTYSTMGTATATPAGSTTEIQYNNAGAMGASSSFTWNDTTKQLNLNMGSTATGGMTIQTSQIGNVDDLLLLNNTNGGGNASGITFQVTSTDVASISSYDSGVFISTTSSGRPISFHPNNAFAGRFAGTGEFLLGTTTVTTGAALKVGTTDSIMLPVGTDAQRPTGAAGMLRYNTDATPNDKVEYYDAESAGWVQLSGPPLWTDNTTHITRENFHILDAGQTVDTASLNGGAVNIGFIWDPDNGAIRAGQDNYGAWNDANIGGASTAFGYNALASGVTSIAMGSSPQATQNYAVSIGTATEATGYGSVALGTEVDVTGDYSLGIGLGGQGIATDPIVSGAGSFGVFLGDNSGVNISTTNVMAIMGGNVGIKNAAPDVELDVTGDIEYTGTITDVSDMRLKENIEPLIKTGSLLERIDQINTYSFTMKNDEKGRIEYGVMAQELEEIFPELVHTANDEMGTKSVNYVGLIAPMIEATKELKAENIALKSELTEIKTAQLETTASINDLSKQVALLNKMTENNTNKASMESYLFLLLGLLGGISSMAFIQRRKA